MEQTLSDIILDAIRTTGGWLTRKDIAQLIGREKALLPYDKQLIDEMVESGQLEMKRVPRGIGGVRFEYRFKGD